VPAIAPTEPWESFDVTGQGPTVVDWNATEKRMYYGCLSGRAWDQIGPIPADSGTTGTPVQGSLERCLAVSQDGGATWTKPSLGLVRFNGSYDNNILPINGTNHYVYRLLCAAAPLDAA
jgi:hypothetical protein